MVTVLCSSIQTCVKLMLHLVMRVTFLKKNKQTNERPPQLRSLTCKIVKDAMAAHTINIKYLLLLL